MVATSRMTSLCAYLIAKCVCLQSDTYCILDFCLFVSYFLFFSFLVWVGGRD